MKTSYSLILFTFLFLLPSAQGILDSEYQTVDFVVINSNNWEDIYQGLLFAKLTGLEADFVYSPSLASDVAKSIPRTTRHVLLLETTGSEQVKGYEQYLSNQGFRVTKETGATRLGFRLAKKITPAAYVITDSRYPYNAVSLAPYALVNEYYVLFGDELSLEELTSILSEKQRPLITYGVLNNRVSEELNKYNPRIIDQGGKFDNNLYVVDEFIKKKPVNQVILTNGEFIELGLIQSEFPILFIGRTRTPNEVINYVADSDISFFVVVGNHLADLSRTLKQRVEQQSGRKTSVFVRFAKTPRVLNSSFSEPQPLEYFALPIINPQLNISSIAYNRLSNNLEVTYVNPSDITVFFTSTLSLSNPTESVTLGDDDVQFIVSGQQKTLLYSSSLNPVDLSVSVRTIFGDYPKNLEYELTREYQTIPLIDIADDSALEILDAVYDKSNKAFYITVTNPSPVPVYSQLEIIDVIIDGVPQTIGTRNVFLLEPGQKSKQYLRATLSDLDLLENENIHVRAHYGQREHVRFKVAEKILPLKVRLWNSAYTLIGSTILLLVLLIIFLLLRTSYYECDRCGHQQKRRTSTKHSCGGTYKKK